MILWPKLVFFVFDSAIFAKKKSPKTARGINSQRKLRLDFELLAGFCPVFSVIFFSYCFEYARKF